MDIIKEQNGIALVKTSSGYHHVIEIDRDAGQVYTAAREDIDHFVEQRIMSPTARLFSRISEAGVRDVSVGYKSLSKALGIYGRTAR